MFKYVDITSKGCEGWINLFFGDQCICMISDPELATAIKKSINNIVHEKLDALMDMVEDPPWITLTNRQRERLKSKTSEGIMYIAKDIPSVATADRVVVSFTESNQPRTCKSWDCGFCYHDDGPKNGECVGIGECQIWEEI